MQRLMYFVVLAGLCFSAHREVLAAGALCGPLNTFIESVKPNETRALKFHTIWGTFKDSDKPTLGAKRCNHNGYEPAKAVCAYFMAHGAAEFSGKNVEAVVKCLSPKAEFPNGTQLNAISLSMRYGADDHVAHVDVEFAEDAELGGKVLTVTTRGY